MGFFKKKEAKTIKASHVEESKKAKPAPAKKEVKTIKAENVKSAKKERPAPQKKETKTIKASNVDKKVKKEKETPSKKNYHISKRKEDGKWQVKFANGQKAIKLFDTQAEAIEYANDLADSQDGSITIHRLDGKIRKQDYSKK